MIPWVVARELRATLLDYLRSTWSLADRPFEASLFRFLAGPRGIFQGPYLRLGLPFAPCPPGVALPLDVVPPYAPHLHQIQAWQRLSSRGQAPRATLITTGTGSGKTECFLYPVLDHALRQVQAGKGGIKAIILYPMNALASDQAQRFAETIWHDERLRARIRVGLFVGGDGTHREMGRDHVVDDNDRLREEPPDVLLTNYRMLDLLLQRPKDAPLWSRNEPDTLRYLVLDELHTYDGAQGTDVACLLRRLGQRLGSTEAICPVGTSATVGGGADSRVELLRFASTLFDQTFPDDAFIGETRLEPRDLAVQPALAERYPSEAGPWPAPGDRAEDHVRTAARAWLPDDGAAEVLTESGAIDRVALGRWALRLPIVSTLLSIAHRRPRPATELDEALRSELPGYAAGSTAEREGWLASALSLVSFSERAVGDRTLPLVNVQATLWVREVRRLLSRVDDEAQFRFFDDEPPAEGEAWLPLYSCADCGHAGWLCLESGPGSDVLIAYREVARAFQERSPALRLLHREDVLAHEDEGRIAYLDVRGRRLRDKPDDERKAPRVHVVGGDEGDPACPGCGGRRTLRMLGARGTTLSSVAVGHLFTTPLNTDRKLLTFSDSVQDAAHRAGFFGARTYRFSLRTALFAAVPQGDGLPLSRLGDATWALWSERLGKRPGISAEAELAALLLPVDLDFLASVLDWHARLDEHVAKRRQADQAGEHAPPSVPEPGAALLSDLRERLRWECTRELGLASKIGRTLEQSGCLSVTVDRERFERAVHDAADTLREKLGKDVAPTAAALSGCVAGLLTRLRLRGGIHDRLLDRYVRSGGNGFLLSKRQAPLLSPFSSATTRPLFLSDAPKARRFDSVASARATWANDWLIRSLAIAADVGTASEVYRTLLPILEKHGLLASMPTDEGSALPGRKATAWGLVPDTLIVSRQTVVRRCPSCGQELAAVEGSVTDPLGQTCLRFRCEGRYAEHAGETEDHDGALPVATYYRRFYERGELGRLWSREHTGLLPRGPREELELEFKQRPRPDSPNLLSCTPTLEMGIDIGDLSATLLCSVPPGPSNYIQRVGRAGRKTGNALILAFAATRAHDLHFFQEPLEAMAGAIHPPGCYVSAPEVLKRQALAFCFDTFAREGGKLPARVGDVLRGDDAKRFPRPLLDFLAPRRAAMGKSFVDMFGDEISKSARATMLEAFEPAADGLSRIEATLARTTDQARLKRDDLKALAQRLDERIRKLDTEEIEAKKVQDLEEEKGRLRDERRFVQQQLMSLLDRDLWGWLCDESVLPNYAFPERGVKLDAYIRREGVGREPEHHSWVRAPSAALTELAPFNTFYASSRRVKIDGLELKRDAAPAEWRFCRSCHHAETTAVLEAEADACPACGDGGWGDVGLRKHLLVMGQVYAIARHRDAVLGDDAEDRERKYYERVSLFEAESQARDAWSNDTVGFGFELQPRLVLRDLNLGPRDDRSNPQTTVLAGQLVQEVGFRVCSVCGQAQPPPVTGNRQQAPHEPHRSWCPERKKPDDKQSFRQLALMRELRSEALRLVVPLAAAEDLPDQLANLRATLRLGLRRFYGGEPEFLDVRAYDEPLPGSEGRRRFLVIMDRVPGGTGLLAELALDKGAKLKEAFEKAHDALRGCSCGKRMPAVKACYQCLYAYRSSEDLPKLSRLSALALVERLLDGFGSLVRVDTIGTMTQSSVLESELEARFVSTLRERVLAEGGAFTAGDDGTWTLVHAEKKWLLRGQVVLGLDEVPHPCRADFVLYPDGQGPAARPVAIFVDGLAYHVQPGQPTSRLHDDAQKRLGISQGGTMLSWSLTWKDVVSPDSPPVPRWVGDGAALTSLQSMVTKLDEKGPAGAAKLAPLLRIVDGDPMSGLLGYLESPGELSDLAKLAATVLLGRGKRQPRERVDTAQAALRTLVDAGDLALASSEGDVAVARLSFGEHARGLVDVEAASLGTLNGLRVTVRLEDDAETRKLTTFEASWRIWLRAWNLLQALPGARLVTQVGTTTVDEAAHADVVAPPAPPSAASEDTDRRFDVIREIVDADAREAVRELLRRHPDLPAPSVPLELRRHPGVADADLELGWRDRKVAAYFDDQRAAADALTTAGWAVLSVERKLSVDDLEAALGLSKD